MENFGEKKKLYKDEQQIIQGCFLIHKIVILIWLVIDLQIIFKIIHTL